MLWLVTSPRLAPGLCDGQSRDLLYDWKKTGCGNNDFFMDYTCPLHSFFDFDLLAVSPAIHSFYPVLPVQVYIPGIPMNCLMAGTPLGRK